MIFPFFFVDDEKKNKKIRYLHFYKSQSNKSADGADEGEILQQFDDNYGARYDRHLAAITRLDRTRITLRNRFPPLKHNPAERASIRRGIPRRATVEFEQRCVLTCTRDAAVRSN